MWGTVRRLAAPMALAIVVVACGGSDAGTSTIGTDATTTTTAVASEVVSADGRATLVAAGAASDLSIESVDAAALGLPEDLPTFGAYELGPSGFDGGATVTIETDVEWGDQLPVLVGLLGTADGEWEVLRTAVVGSTDGNVTIAFEVPHFSPLVIVGSDLALDMDPYDVFASVGEHWDAWWDIVDPRTMRITNGPAMRGFFYDFEVDHDVIGTVRPILDEVDVEVQPRTSGVVGHVPGESEVGTYGYEPTTGFFRGSVDPGPVTEVFYGVDTFTCVSPGTGYYGYSIDLTVRRSDLLIGARFAGRVALINPADGVRIQYDVAGRATCEEHPYVPLARFLQGYQGFSAQRVANVLRALTGDTGSGGLYSISMVMPGGFRPAVDLSDHSGVRYDEPDRLRLDLTYNLSVFECGETVVSEELNGLEVTTVCPADVVPIEEGGLIVIAATYMDLIPGPGAGEYYTYAAVFDSNGDPSDDWVYQGEYDWDLYQGTDRWYQVNWDPAAQEWSMLVSAGLDAYGPSAARAMLFGDTILWLIPAAEFSADLPAYRVTSFVHDGTFAPEVSGGDVSGLDPTEPPIAVHELAG